MSVSSWPMPDHRRNPRRRGAALERAILDATAAELDHVGYAGLTVESVAARAGAGKDSIYRRWPSKAALVVAAAYDATTPAATPPDTGSLRGDTFAWLRTLADLVNGTLGQALLGLVAEAVAHGDTAELGALSQDRGRAVARMLIDRARRRGEDVPGGQTPVQLAAPANALKYLFLTGGTPIPDAALWALVDELAIPLWTGNAPQRP